MNRDDETIERFASRVERRLAGPASYRAQARAEVVDHLSGAAEAGELPETLHRLGDPESAAQSFVRSRPAPRAAFASRAAAATLDNLPLLGVTAALLWRALAEGWETVVVTFPPALYLRFGDSVCVGSPVAPACDTYAAAGSLYTLGVPLALLWSVVGLGLLESRFGATPGKRVLGLWVVDDTGLRIGPGAGVLRRLSFLVGPLAWLDWVPFLAGHRRRLLDHVAGTEVVQPARAR